MSGAPWRPLLEGDDAARALEAVHAIAADLAAIESPAPELNGGQSARAVLHSYLARTGDEAAGDRAAEALELALDRLDQVRRPWLLDGLAGVAWTVAHMADLVDIEPDTFEALDDLVARLLTAERWTLEWEYVLGLIGLGVYALERPGPPGDAILARVVEHLAALAERPGGAITWRSPVTLLQTAEHREQNRDGYYNLGLAHGVVGAAILLAEAAARAIPGAADLLPGSIAWLLAQDTGDPRMRFPLMIARGVEHNAQRDGWCYGDQAVAVALVRAGQVIGEAAWIEHGLSAARDVARRQPTMPLDAAFCHGTLGRAHMFNRLAQTSGDEELAEAARHWYRATLDRRAGGTGVGGFVSSDGPAEATSILMGSTGIALGLVAAASPVEPGWDRAFLVALPPGASAD